MLSLPTSARVACWLNAWLDSRESADATISGINGKGRLAEVLWPESGSACAPALLLGEVRRRGVQRASCALPVPGDPLGLGGPAPFNAEALEVAEAVVLHGAGLGLVPTHDRVMTRWHVFEAHPPTYLADVSEADRDLRTAMLTAAGALAELDVAAWGPEVADALLDLRQPAALDEPTPFASGRAARLAHDALRASAIVSLARVDDGGAVSAMEAVQRAAALQPLDRAARSALVAATSTRDGR